MSKISVIAGLGFILIALVGAIIGVASTQGGWFSASATGVSASFGTLKGCVEVDSVGKVCLKIGGADGDAGKAALALCVLAMAALIASAVFAALYLINIGGRLPIVISALLCVFAFAALTSAWAAYLGVVYSNVGDNGKPSVSYALILAAVGSGSAAAAAAAFFFGFIRHDRDEHTTKPRLGYSRAWNQL